MRRLRSLLGVGGIVMVLVTTAACGGNERDATASALDSGFEIVEHDAEHAEVVGHGISMLVPASWEASGEEKVGQRGDTYEWAVQAEAGGDSFPPFVNMSMAVPDKESTSLEAAIGSLKAIQGVDPDFSVDEEGEVEVPGAEKAYQLRFERTDTYQGQEVSVEMVQLFLVMPDDLLSTVRFQAPAGEFDESGLQAVRDSLVVDVDE